MPQVRSWSDKIFQLGHLLMFPFFVMLMAHGTANLLQFQVMGIVISFPVLMVLLERSLRIIRGFIKVPATLEVLDEETVVIEANTPELHLWSYRAGQYVFLQIPQISRWQWHPFIVSERPNDSFKLRIKSDGNWTSKLRSLTELTHIGVDGPYGAPAQHFYDFDQTIIVGSGIGVTPFSGILTDLQRRQDHTPSHCTIGSSQVDLKLYRRVDFQWILRERHYIEWFSSLLNKISTGGHNPNLDIRLSNWVTKKRKNMVPHVYRYILERHRTKEQPYSALTGLVASTHFGRPDFEKILNKHHEEILVLFAEEKKRDGKVGVFFCELHITLLDSLIHMLGAPIVGEQLADLCHELTLQGRNDKSEIKYRFQIEVSG